MGRSKAIVLHSHQQHQKKLSEAVYRPSSIRIRRAILAGKRGPTTPVPSWKLYENPSFDGVIAGNDASGRQITISARKLAATLWELQELPICKPPPASKSSASGTKGSTRLPPRSSRGPRQREGSPEPLMLPPPSPATPVPQNYVKPPSTKSSDSHRRSPYSDSVTYHSRRASQEIFSETPPRQSFEAEQKADEKAELLKVLSNISNQAGSNPLSAVLRAELEHTRHRVRELEVANKCARRDIEALVERAQGDRAREQERFRAAVVAAKEEAEEERRLKRKAELVNRRLEQQLGEVSSELSRARKEVERERKARQLMEDVCDELAREIGHDKAEVEQLKRESEKVREEVEEERRMLQMAEVWREERVQMKLAEARHELEDKNAALDRLRAELEEFLLAKASLNNNLPAAAHHHHHPQEKAEQLRVAVDSLRKRNEEVGGTSAEEDLHSIDLNKESLFDRTQGNRWTYNRGQSGGAAQGVWMNEKKAPELRRKVFKGRRRIRKQRVYDESQAAEDEQQQGFVNGNEPGNGPNQSCSEEFHHHRAAAAAAAGVSPSLASLRGGRRIDTIPEQPELPELPEQPEQQEELYQNSSKEEEEEEEDDGFVLGFAQRDGGNCRTPTLSPLLNSSASFPLSSVATPQRNSWSSGDLNPQLAKAIKGGSVEWPRIGGTRDNSLRAKLLEAKLEDPHAFHHHHHHRSKRDKVKAGN